MTLRIKKLEKENERLRHILRSITYSDGNGGVLNSYIEGFNLTMYFPELLAIHAMEEIQSKDKIMSDSETTIYISCPFCGEPDFDLIGLKLHISRDYCDSCNDLETTDKPPRR